VRVGVEGDGDVGVNVAREQERGARMPEIVEASFGRKYIHPYNDAGGRLARCRVPIYIPDDMRDAPMVICSELPNNPRGSLTNSAR
jgi:hypothetical protein